uniref:AlNc14C11G1396 protein n=1 Tax=Albugo laibachii Nc14 TaxID=890382 RepID=F0W317_9STRA|nr:AlNc14C11G1396 [Albugo laibachii Nc14]|eukprot:CCA15454.1 AlNc14C11G1396 [Albugo laibachii Nc14]
MLKSLCHSNCLTQAQAHPLRCHFRQKHFSIKTRSRHSNAQDVEETNVNGIETINANMEIFKIVLTQLLLYYTRLVIAKRSSTRPHPYSNEILTAQEVLVKTKKYSRFSV